MGKINKLNFITMKTIIKTLFGNVERKIYKRDNLGRFTTTKKQNEIDELKAMNKNLDEALTISRMTAERWRRMYESISEDNLLKDKQLAEIKKQLKTILNNI